MDTFCPPRSPSLSGVSINTPRITIRQYARNARARCRCGLLETMATFRLGRPDPDAPAGLSDFPTSFGRPTMATKADFVSPGCVFHKFSLLQSPAKSKTNHPATRSLERLTPKRVKRSSGFDAAARHQQRRRIALLPVIRRLCPAGSRCRELHKTAPAAVSLRAILASDRARGETPSPC